MSRLKRWWMSSSCARLCCGSSWWDALETFRRAVWVLAVAACSYFMVAQVLECVDKLKNPPIVTQTQVVVEDRLDYPAVTFCYKNSEKQGYDRQMLEYLGLRTYWIDFNSETNDYTVWWEFFDRGNNMTFFWDTATYRLEGQLGPTPMKEDEDNVADRLDDSEQPPPPQSKIRVFFASLNMVSSLEGGVAVSTSYFHDHGKCYTFTPPTNSSFEKPIAGHKYGYKIFFQYVDNSASCETSLMVDGGMDIFIHNAGDRWIENPLLESRGEHLFVHSGHQAYVKISKSFYNMLDRDEEPCVEAGYYHASSYGECLEKCRWGYLAEKYQCAAPFMPLVGWPECSDYETATYLMEEYQEWVDTPNSKDDCQSRCPPSCQRNIYSAQVVKTKDMDCKQSEFHIYFSSGETQEMFEEWGYDRTLFVSDFGGSLGFLLGISILSILEIFESFLINTVEFCKRRWQQHKLGNAVDGGTGLVTIEELREMEEKNNEDEEDKDCESERREESQASTVVLEEEDDGKFDEMEEVAETTLDF